MPQDIVKHSFEKGLNKDISKSKIQPNQYWDAKNITVALNEEGNLASVTNIKGNTKHFTLPYLAVDIYNIYVKSSEDNSTLQTISFSDVELILADLDPLPTTNNIVGYTTIRTKLILLTRPESDFDGLSFIWSVDLNDLTTEPVLLYIGKLNFPLSPIDVEGNYESETIQKIYWADGTNELGHFNISDSEGYKLNADKLFNSGLVTLNNLSLDSISGSGNFSAGVIQYTYQYYDKNGVESSIGPMTNPIPISESLKKGNLKTDENIGKNFTLSLTVDTQWEYIRIYRVSYSANASTPTQIDVIIDQKNISNLTFTDDGTVSLRTATSSELLNIVYSTLIPNNIKTKDQRLIIGNYTESVYNPSFDARAYRFPSSSTETLIYDSDGNNYTVDSTDSFKITEENGTPVTSYTVPETHDCINDDNSNNYFDPSSDNMYVANSSSLGASGLNVAVNFITESLVLDNDITNYTGIQRTDGNLGSAIVSQKRSWKRDEIYRVGVVLINTKGQESPPKWICDLRIPSANQELLSSVSSGIVSAEYIYPNFAFQNLPDDCVAVKIVRVERTEKDKTIISQGYVLPVSRGDDGIFYPVGSTTNYLAKSSVVQYNTTNSYSNGDYVYCPNYDVVIEVTGSPPSNVTELGLTGGYATDPGTAAFDNKPVTNIFNSSDQFETDDGRAVVYWVWGGLSQYNEFEIVKNKIVFYSPELDFGKTIDTSDSNYLNVAQIVSTGGEHYVGTSLTPTSGILNNQASSVNLYNFEKAMTTYALTGTYDESLSINASKILDTDVQDVISGSTVVNSPTFETTDGFNPRHNIGLFISLDSSPTLPNNQEGIYLFDYKRPLLNQYGGQTYAARSNNTYITASNLATVSSNTVSGFRAKYGDTFISEWNHFPTYRRGDSDVVRINSTILLVESDYDLTKRLVTDIGNVIVGNGFEGKRDFVRDTYEPLSSFAEYINDVYNIENIFNTYYLIDDDEVEISYASTFKISELKFNNETIDSWLQFLANNYLDVDGKYGPVNSINEINDTIIFFQDDAIGQLSINPRAIASTSEGNIILGTGGILDDYRYITTTHGCKHRESIVKTPKGLYYYDGLNYKLRQLGDEQSPLSDLKGLHSYLKTNATAVGVNPVQANGVTTGYNYSTNTVYFTFHTPTPFTIQFDETLNNVECFIDCHPLMWLTTRQGIFSTMSESEYNTNTTDQLYQMGVGEYGKFFGTLYPSYIEFIINANPDVIKCVNNLEFFSEVLSSGVESATNSFDYLRVYNNYQDTTELPLTQNSRFHFQDRKWRLVIPRNYKPYNPTLLSQTSSENDFVADEYVLHPVTFYLYKVKATVTNYELPSDNSLDQSLFERVLTPLDRMRDFFNIVNLKFTNDGTSKLICHDILAKYDFNV